MKTVLLIWVVRIVEVLDSNSWSKYLDWTLLPGPGPGCQAIARATIPLTTFKAAPPGLFSLISVRHTSEKVVDSTSTLKFFKKIISFIT
jgi:hypothetical protein